MADDLEDRPNNLHPFANGKDAIYATFNNLRIWREAQLQEFRNRHHLENEKLLRLSSESQKQFEPVSEKAANCPESQENPRTFVPENSDASSISLANDSENYDSLCESSVTGHLQRCFDDSSQSNLSTNPNKVSSAVEKIPIFSELRNQQFPTKNVNDKEQQLVKDGAANCLPKRPFLKRGTGLLRYKQKPPVKSKVTKNTVPSKMNNPLKKTTQLPQKTLTLKPAIRKMDVPSSQKSTSSSSSHVKHIRFDIPLSDKENPKCLTEDNLSPEVDEQTDYGSTSFDHIPAEDNKSEDEFNSRNENLNLLKENKELEEFELLENFAQNSSFNSDSSIVQRILHGDSNKPISSVQRDFKKPFLENAVPVYKEIVKSSSETTDPTDKIGLILSKCHKEAQEKLQAVQKVISDIPPSIQSLQKEISRSQQEHFNDSDVSDRCSTPIEDFTLEGEIPSSALPDTDSNAGLNFQYYPSTNFGGPSGDGASEAAYQCDCTSCGIDDDVISCPNQEHYANILDEEEKSVSEVFDEVHKNKVVEKPIFHEACQELNKEIEKYQELNEKLSNICKEKNETLKKYQKEVDDFNKYKEKEKQKIEAEIEEKRLEIKRQKDTFMRYQKLRKDHPTRKERDEFNALRQEVEKLQEELKRQKIKYTSDSRRWKSRLDNAEKERDSFKLENIRLEEQCQDLLDALKTRMKKKPEEKSFNVDGEYRIEENVIKAVTLSKDAECQTETDYFNSDINKDLNEASSKCTNAVNTNTEVNFKSPLEHDKYEMDIPSQDVNSKIRDCFTDKYPSERNNMTNSNYNRSENGINDTGSGNLSIISISVETEFKEIEHSDRKEKIFPSGEREIIFHNGTRKIISADGMSIKFLFFNGDVKEIFSDGREIYRYMKGVIESHFPDGLKTTEFPNGQIQLCYPDGQKEIRFPNGSVQSISPDGCKEIHSTDGNVTTLSADGTKTIKFANGQKEIRTASYRRREFPDGSVKIFYKNGRQETRFSDGRIRIKDKEGKIVVDTKYLGISKGQDQQN